MHCFQIHLAPIASLLLLSTVSCSSKTEPNQKSTDISNNNAPSVEVDAVLLNDATDSFTASASDNSNPGANALSISDMPVEREHVPPSDSLSNNVDVTPVGLKLHASNVEQVAKSAVHAINRSELEKQRTDARALLFALSASGWDVVAGENGYAGLTVASQESVESEYGGQDYAQTFVCDEGGLLTVLLRDFNDGPFYHNRVSFENCQLNGELYDGRLESSGARRAPDITIFGNYSRTSTGNSITITGEHTHTPPFFGHAESNTWADTSFTSNSSAGTTSVDNLQLIEQGADSPHMDDNQGFVLLTDGTVKHVAEFNRTAHLQASFSFTPTQSSTDTLNVEVNLGYQNRYFDWQGHYQSGFELPIFPVSDLGTAIDVYPEFDIHSGTSRLFDSLPKDPSPQWQDGEIRITATDSTSLVMTPDSDNAEMVLFELNNSGEKIPKPWVAGYQVDCPSAVGQCGG